MRRAAYIGGLLGLALLVWLLARSDLAGIARALRLGGAGLLWLVPYRLLFFVLYALGWAVLLAPCDPTRRATLRFLTWVATVREGIDRLLPVASVGGAVVAVRLLRWRGIGFGPGAASVVVEVVLTLLAVWVFALLGMALLGGAGHTGLAPLALTALLAGGVALPVGLALLLHSGAVFGRLGRALSGLLGLSQLVPGAQALDMAVRATLRRYTALALSGTLQLLALVSGAFEVWLALRLFGHPLGAREAIVIESLTQAARHVAFMVPGALGVQEGALVLLGASFGINAELALAVSLVKRLRELAWGIPALVSWQWEEGRRLSCARGP